jgi:hypothetical protein
MVRSSFAILLLCGGQALAGQLFLGQVPVEAEAGAALDHPVRVRLELRPAAAGLFTELESRVPLTRGSGSVEVLLDGYPAARDAVVARHSQPSFLVDFDEAPVRDLRDAIRKQASEHPRPEQLEAFVARHIDRKTYRRGQDPASVVARIREGDCKAHAVLLAALARMFGIPARMVLGLVIVDGKSGPLAFGHAWVEVHDEGAWRAADAIDFEHSPTVLRLPLAIVADEGPGFTLSMLNAQSVLQGIEAIRLRPANEQPRLQGPESSGAARQGSRSSSATPAGVTPPSGR